MAVGQVFYTPWCDEHGKVIDDGTVSRLAEQALPLDGGRSEPALVPRRTPPGLTCTSRTSRRRSRRWRCRGRRRRGCCDAVVGRRHRPAEVFPRDQRHASAACRSTSRAPATPAISATRSGCRRSDAVARVGRADGAAARPFDIKPAGMLALDVARIEAGLLLIDVDFFSSRKALIDGAEVLAVRDGPRPAGQPRQGPVHRPARAARASSARGPRAADRRTRDRLERRRAAVRAPSACRRPSPRPRRASRCRSTAAAGRWARPRPRRGRRC